MDNSTMKQRRPRKPYYELTELYELWSLNERDIAAYVLERELNLSIAVAGLRVETYDIEEDDRGGSFSIPTGTRWVVGTMDLGCIDAWTVMQHGRGEFSYFWTAEGERLEVPFVNDEPQVVVVERSALVVRRAEKERFELAQGLVQPPVEEREPERPPSPGRQRGAPPKYDWEACWCEIAATIYDPGPPRTQAQWLEQLRSWFAAQLGPDNVPSDSAIKQRLSRIWPRVKPDLGRPSANMVVNGARAAAAAEKGAQHRR
jgi:hypothetical protein